MFVAQRNITKEGNLKKNIVAKITLLFAMCEPNNALTYVINPKRTRFKVVRSP